MNTQTPDLQAAVERLEKVEKQNRRLKIVGAVALPLVTSLLVGAFGCDGDDEAASPAEPPSAAPPASTEGTLAQGTSTVPPGALPTQLAAFSVTQSGVLTATVTGNVAPGLMQVAFLHDGMGYGEVNYPFLLAEIERLGYTGVFGLEYVPSLDDETSLRKTLEHLGR